LRALAEFPLVSPLFSTIKRYERVLSAGSMVAGFAFDNYFFERVDHPATQITLAGYLVVAIGSILLIHFIESRVDERSLLRKGHPLLVVGTQFALGGLWSAFLIFYGRSALAANSWPFLFILAAMMVGNELFREYHSRLAFTCTLLFFALFSYAIFVVPMLVGTMGWFIFLLSGALAVAAFIGVLIALHNIGAERIRKAWDGIGIGAAGVLVSINLSYFTNILPPLPLTLSQAGVFHSVVKEGDAYRAVAEPLGAYAWLAGAPVMHVESGGALSVYSAVFAPIQLRTNIVHIWQRYDEARMMWRTESTLRFSIVGGREGGYRGYSNKSAPANGRWRVNIETPDGLVIGRVAFFVAPGSADGRTEQILR